MSLLQTRQQPADAGFFSSSIPGSMAPNPSLSLPPEALAPKAPQSMPEDPLAENSPLNLDIKEVEKQYRSQMNEKSQAAMKKFLKEGSDILFGPNTHYKVMKGIEKSKDVGGDVGRGAAFVVDMLIQHSTNLDQDQDAQAAVIPAGALLLTDIAQYLNESGIPFTEQDYAKAMDIFNATIQGKYNPAYKAKMDEHKAQPQAQAQASPQTAMAPEQGIAQGLPAEGIGRASLGGGLLNRGGL